MSTMDLFQIKIFDSLFKIKATDWKPLEVADFPFTDYEFLSALESAGCFGAHVGWLPFYVTVWDDEQLLGVLILFSKDNSYGEFIFDFGWADGAHSAGIPYYPKLISAVPFTPATGSKILVRSDLNDLRQDHVRAELLNAAETVLRQSGSSSLHFLFIPPAQISLYEKNNFFIRHSFQYHWENKNYSTFDDFLKTLKGKRRREVVRERSQVQKQGIKIKWLTGNDLTPQQAEVMHLFYQSTMGKKQGFEFLNLEFFKTFFATMKEKIMFVVAYNANGEPVAGALNLIGTQRLFGRYWGCLADYRALHFELCYYQGIDFCIRYNLKIFEAGAQGEHKFNRGFLPALTYSSHRIQHPGLAHAIQDYVEREKKQLKLMFDEYQEHTPYL
jgi:uncharacterized protein